MPSFWFPDLASSILRTFTGWGIRLHGATSGAVGLLPPAVAGSTDYVLPGSAPGTNGQALVATTGGLMSWDGPYAALSGATFTGDLKFSGAGHLGLTVNNLTTTQRDAIASPATGTIVYNTTTARMEAYSGSAWQQHVRVSGDTMTGQLVNSTAGSASTSPLLFSGSILAGGTGTTNFPHLFFQNASATAATNWGTNGTYLGANANSGFIGNFLDFKVNGTGTSALLVNAGGTIAAAGRFSTSVGVGASAAAISLTGLMFTGGTGTTNFPAIFAQRTGVTAVTTWSTAGTYFGVNADSGFAGSFIDCHVNGGASVFNVSSAGNVSANNVTVAGNLVVAAQTPATSGSAGTVGTFAYDSSYLYICIATNTWRRAAHATW